MDERNESSVITCPIKIQWRTDLSIALDKKVVKYLAEHFSWHDHRVGGHHTAGEMYHVPVTKMAAKRGVE